MIHVHTLGGCAPAPLAHYLKALGVLRLVSEQADAQARGWWEGDRYRLATKLTEEELEGFFLEDYQPTPMFNPWGARSGYFDGGPEKTARVSLQRIECSNNTRLAPFQRTIKSVRAVIQGTASGNKPSDKAKHKLVLDLRRQARSKSSLWLDAVVAVLGTGDDVSLAQPPIFGTGGSEGSGGYPSAYMAAVVEAIVSKCWNHAVRTALFGDVGLECDWRQQRGMRQRRDPGQRPRQSFGQFLPSRAFTPWDMLLAFEGACVLRSSTARRTSTHSPKWMSSPFYVAPRSAGYASGARLDEKRLQRGKEYAGRGEQWFPMWTNPTRFSDVQQIFLQGRAATKVGHATDGWSMARAVTSLGVSRGISEFIRYGYQQRNNQATHFAVPLGRYSVPVTRPATPRCLDDLDKWLASLQAVAHPTDDRSAKASPARLTGVYRRLNDCLYSILEERATPQRWQDALLRLGDMEAVMRHGSGFRAQPVPPLRPEWVLASNDGTGGFRLALSLALQFVRSAVGGRLVNDHVRRHWLPLERKRSRAPSDPERNPRFAVTGDGRLDSPPEVVMHGRRGIEDAIALVERRLVEASQRGGRHLPLNAAPRAAAAVTDLARLVSGDVNTGRTLALARALMALDHEAWARGSVRLDVPHTEEWPDDAWLAIRLCMLPWPLETRSGFELDIGADPAILRRLRAGDAASAVEIALRRLRAAGVRCGVRRATASFETARLWAAALAFPITKKTAKRFLYRLDPDKELA